MDKYLKYKNKYLQLKNQVAGRFNSQPEPADCFDKGLEKLGSVGFEYEAGRNFALCKYERLRDGTYLLTGTNEDVILINNDGVKKFVISTDTTVVDCVKRYTKTFSIFNYGLECGSRVTRPRTRFDFTTTDGTIHITNGSDARSDIYHTEFISTYFTLDGSRTRDVILKKNIDTLKEIRDYFSQTTRITLYGNPKDIKKQAKIDLSSDNQNSLINKLIRLQSEEFILTPEIIDLTTINSIDLLLHEGSSRAFIVYSTSDFSLTEFLNPGTPEIRWIELFRMNFFSQVTVGSKLENLYKNIRLIEKDCGTKCDDLSLKIIDILCAFKNSRPPLTHFDKAMGHTDTAVIGDQEISILYLILHYLFIICNEKSTDYKFDVKYSLRHFFDIIFRTFGYASTRDETILRSIIQQFLSFLTENTGVRISFYNIIDVRISQEIYITNVRLHRPINRPKIGKYIFQVLSDSSIELIHLLNNRGKGSNRVTAWDTAIYDFPEYMREKGLLMEVRGKDKILHEDTIQYLQAQALQQAQKAHEGRLLKRPKPNTDPESDVEFLNW
jgi:hypothetical protein